MHQGRCFWCSLWSAYSTCLTFWSANTSTVGPPLSEYLCAQLNQKNCSDKLICSDKWGPQIQISANRTYTFENTPIEHTPIDKILYVNSHHYCSRVWIIEVLYCTKLWTEKKSIDYWVHYIFIIKLQPALQPG